ncbi:hypothetical protein HPB47_009133 [Ixodes persulcatus]|uniref:Uncharacterized protein n=1 Tax=Ixodes persulcatus TaxID=34615 RepID=A0AC60P2Q9_IXOPE|nr:hypothetical protein HPB47_009133 [Ixodes persulcatus]
MRSGCNGKPPESRRSPSDGQAFAKVPDYLDKDAKNNRWEIIGEEFGITELSAFGTYIQNFWIDSSSVQNLWGIFGNTGPQTTNHVEGWHNGLRDQLPNHHPQLAEVAQFLRMQQHCSQVRMSSLLHDQLAVPRQQDPAVSRKNAKLAAEMEQFGAHVTYNLVSFDVVRQYLDIISGIGVLPSA